MDDVITNTDKIIKYYSLTKNINWSKEFCFHKTEELIGTLQAQINVIPFEV
jgi:hypothetical protein